MTRTNEDSKHFAQIWAEVIVPVRDVVQKECDPAFIKRCGLDYKDTKTWQKLLESAYRDLRRDLKAICYGDGRPANKTSEEEQPFRDRFLDGRKIASVLCAALIRRKVFKFDVSQARALEEEKRVELAPVAFNFWAAQNVYVNYKLAYYASLQLVYLTLMYDFIQQANDPALPGNEREEAVALASRLCAQKHLCPYPPPKRGDGFNVNVILGLARADLNRRELDTFLFAMQLYQIEQHTIDTLKRELARGSAAT